MDPKHNREQSAILGQLAEARSQLRVLWKSAFDNFQITGLSKETFHDRQAHIGTISSLLNGFNTNFGVPKDLISSDPEEADRLNETGFRERLKKHLPKTSSRYYFTEDKGDISSMDIVRLGTVLLAESNLLRITDVAQTLQPELDPNVDVIKKAQEIADSPPPKGFSKELPNRLGQILRYRSEEDLRNDPKFAIFVAAILNFHKEYES